MLSYELLTVLACALLARQAIAHPGHDHHAEIAQRSEYMRHAEKRSLAHCADVLKARGVAQRSHLRRRQLAETLRQKRGLAAGKVLIQSKAGNTY
jgi:hypothetical protein